MPVVKITKQGQADIEGIYIYAIKEWGWRQAEDYKNALAEILKNLSRSPQIGRLRKEIRSDLRSFPSLKHIIYYLEINEGIEIVRILRHAMDSKKAMKK